MKKRLLIALTALLLLAGCTPSPAASADDTPGLTILTTTYPVYLFASAVTEGVEGVTVERLDTGETSCLHDYTLSVSDMKKIEGADVIAISGAGLEDFMDDALTAGSAAVIDCSTGVELLESLEHDHQEGDEHDHGHYDPHYWMDPANAAAMVANLQAGLIRLDPAHEETYRSNALGASALLTSWESNLHQLLDESQHNGVAIPGLITFHDGFQYFSKAFNLPLLAAIEEEAGSEASAKEITEITQLVQEYALPVIFTEVNGSDSTAKAISRETGCAVAQLTMLMDGPEDGAMSHYFDGLLENMAAIINGFAGEDVVIL